MFTSGLVPFFVTTVYDFTYVIGVPTGIKIFSWTATLFGGKIHYTTAMLFGIGFVGLCIVGGITGIFLAAIPFDLHSPRYVSHRRHIHYVLVGGSLMGIFAAMYYWFPKMSGRLLNETLGKIYFWLFFVAQRDIL